MNYTKKKIIYNIPLIVKILCFSALSLLIAYSIWAFFFRDRFVMHDCRSKLEELAPSDVSEILIGHELINKVEDISCIVSALKKNKSMTSAVPWLGGPMLRIHYKNGKQLIFGVYRDQIHPDDTILDFGEPFTLQLRVKDFARVIDSFGSKLPDHRFYLSENTGKIEKPILSKSVNSFPHTLFNIQSPSCLEIPNDMITKTIIFGFIMAAVLIPPLVTGFFEAKYAAYRDPHRPYYKLIAAIIVIVLLAAGAVYSALQYDETYKHFEILKTLLAQNKCQKLCGKLTDVRYVYGDHGWIHLHMIEINGHQFSFPRFNKSVYDVDTWEGWAPEQLQIGTPVCVWYATIEGWNDFPEHIARIDIL